MATQNDTGEHDLRQLIWDCSQKARSAKALATHILNDFVDIIPANLIEGDQDRTDRCAATAFALIDLCDLLEDKIDEVEGAAIEIGKAHRTASKCATAPCDLGVVDREA